MCRLAAYLGPEIPLNKFLMEPCHSLYHQSWAPEELDEAKLNADGFGFAWQDTARETHVYTNTQPIWSDHNLATLGQVLSSRCWLANVRSATPGQAVTHTNTQPFKSGPLLFAHNGFIEDFHPAVQTSFHERLTPAIQAEIRGHTDSEYLFALFKQARQRSDDILHCFVNLFSTLADLAADRKVLLNLIVHDGQRFHLLRHAINAECPSLYVSGDDRFFPQGANVIASEALTRSGTWRAVPAHHYAMITHDKTPDFIAL